MVMWRVFQSKAETGAGVQKVDTSLEQDMFETVDVADDTVTCEAFEKEDAQPVEKESTAETMEDDGILIDSMEEKDWEWVDLGQAGASNSKTAHVVDDYFTGCSSSDNQSSTKVLSTPPSSDGDGTCPFTEASSDNEFVDLEVAQGSCTKTSTAETNGFETDKSSSDQDDNPVVEQGSEPYIGVESSGSVAQKQDCVFEPPPRTQAQVGLPSTPSATSKSAEFDKEMSGSVDDPVYQCLECCNPILKASEIISSSYRAMTGPGFLTSAACNVAMSEIDQEAVYTSGRYTVREVTCERCSMMLGITYVGAAVIWNKHKVGKFLLGQNLLTKAQR